MNKENNKMMTAMHAVIKEEYTPDNFIDKVFEDNTNASYDETIQVMAKAIDEIKYDEDTIEDDLISEAASRIASAYGTDVVSAYDDLINAQDEKYANHSYPSVDDLEGTYGGPLDEKDDNKFNDFGKTWSVFKIHMHGSEPEQEVAKGLSSREAASKVTSLRAAEKDKDISYVSRSAEHSKFIKDHQKPITNNDIAEDEDDEDLDEDFKDRQKSIRCLKDLGKNYNFDRFSDQQLYVMCKKAQREAQQLAQEHAEMEDELENCPEAQTCPQCGGPLNDAGECPKCDLGDENESLKEEDTKKYNYKSDEVDDMLYALAARNDLYKVEVECNGNSVTLNDLYTLGKAVVAAKEEIVDEINNIGWDNIKEIRPKFKKMKIEDDLISIPVTIRAYDEDGFTYENDYENSYTINLWVESKSSEKNETDEGLKEKETSFEDINVGDGFDEISFWDENSVLGHVGDDAVMRAVLHLAKKYYIYNHDKIKGYGADDALVNAYEHIDNNGVWFDPTVEEDNQLKDALKDWIDYPETPAPDFKDEEVEFSKSLDAACKQHKLFDFISNKVDDKDIAKEICLAFLGVIDDDQHLSDTSTREHLANLMEDNMNDQGAIDACNSYTLFDYIAENYYDMSLEDLKGLAETFLDAIDDWMTLNSEYTMQTIRDEFVNRDLITESSR